MRQTHGISRIAALAVLAGGGLVLFGVWGLIRNSGQKPAQAPGQSKPADNTAVLTIAPAPAPPSPPLEHEPETASVPMTTDRSPEQGPEETSPLVEARIKSLKSSNIRPQLFRTRIEDMAKSGDEVSVATLIALSNEHYDELAVVEVLGEVRRPGQRQKVAEHLRARIAGSPLTILMAALQSYARVMGDDAVPDLRQSIRDQWRRQDGFGERVCKAAVQGLGGIPTPAAQAALIAELDRVAEPGWLPDYGSAVVAELGRRRTSEASAALLRYADALEKKMPPENNPPGRRYYLEKIAEARQAATGPVTESPGP